MPEPVTRPYEPPAHDRIPDRDLSLSRTARRFVIGFAVVEAVLFAWMLASGRIG